jgi:hypothetical protein
MAAKACLHAGCERMVKGSDQFTFLMQQATSFMSDGMAYDIAQNELNELAAMMYHGITVADFRSREAAHSERELAEEFKKGIHILTGSPEDLADALGIDPASAMNLLDAETEIISYE